MRIMICEIVSSMFAIILRRLQVKIALNDNPSAYLLIPFNTRYESLERTVTCQMYLIKKKIK